MEAFRTFESDQLPEDRLALLLFHLQFGYAQGTPYPMFSSSGSRRVADGSILRSAWCGDCGICTFSRCCEKSGPITSTQHVGRRDMMRFAYGSPLLAPHAQPGQADSCSRRLVHPPTTHTGDGDTSTPGFVESSDIAIPRKPVL
ncbi:hypothetical protein EJ06DRAFT_519804 [Trichodelitschia bisporula]|uniref:Uncharacterized protein n=1 Tax=Trichodelitschia bisporula TaxID=703511 RepID=A0A6G1I3A0_9PEZI|nr:hypothetical protein EJ06DRAFT_519804 [Trichodelitschia bisporula]